jgi:hypothetical protein
MIQAGGGTLALAALASWLATESLGLVMLREMIARGGARERTAQPDRMPAPVLLGHAGLAFSGFVCWIAYLASGAWIAAWIAVGLLGPAIGLGISTVTVWTPYPARRRNHGPGRGPASRVLADDALHRMLSDEKLTSALIDDLLSSNLGPPPDRRSRVDLRPLVPLAHGAFAIVTFMLATLAAVAAL